MKHITHQMAREAINSLGADKFDAHDVERRILRLHADAVAQEMLEFNGDILRNFSARFAKWIDAEFQGQIKQTKKVTSDNLGGKPSRNQQWSKLSAGRPVT